MKSFNTEHNPSAVESGNRFDDDGREKRTGTFMTASAHIITAVIGSGVLSLSWAIAQLGWLAGTVILVTFASINYYTSTMLADCYRSPDTAPGTRNYTYMDVVRAYLGGRKVQLCGLAQYGSLVGVTIGYTITASISLVAIGKANCFHDKGHDAKCSLSNYPSMAAFGIVQLMLSQIPNFHKLSFLSIIATDTLKSTPPENKVMKKASLAGVSTTTVFYILCGGIGYAAFGNKAPGDLLTDFGFYEPYWLIDFANACIVLHLIAAYQVFAQPIFQFVEKKCNKKWPESIFITSEHSMNIPLIGKCTINLFRLLWRTCYVVLTTVVAMIFPFFNAILGLLGALAFWPLTVYFPVAMHIEQAKVKKYSLRWIGLKLLVSLCLIVSLLATIGSIVGLITSVKAYKPFNN
ncbi:unnamed protein product [Arabidopsis lyrata]|nr:unnamed protein product [Arabidopsis lyrata]